MRRACILRQLGRCADHHTPSPPPSRCGPEAAPWLRPLRRGPSGALHFQRRSFSQSPLARKEAWDVAPPRAPSVHPHPHHDAAFDALPPPEQLRSVMRLLAHSVVVCTSADPSAPAGAAAPVPRGMTMSSFTSLSLRPTPLVTFNIATPSRTLDAVSRSRRFNIHVLSGDVAGARVAEWFRKGNADGLGVFEAGRLRDECGCEVVAAEAGADASGKAAAAPPLLKGPGVLFALRCSLMGDEPARGLVRVRDHVIVLAEVVDIIEGQGGKTGPAAFGLAYADRLYRQLGSTMALTED
ncbi:hypothetical protein KVR01_011215 [Diaporthe batatas]|uniref:uncharacterized protein n=1 Tax=Diaporthe batatas TaxID=748121 RepID=UPI001D0385DD|nr:uncharacterized protein KVR01_011215 [Diaporthe batatas]KAG8158772.1 hypothetical protein KVR01_011215 [Diaporthe batatas]